MTSTSRQARVILTLAAIAIGFSAADTYVVVLALPEMMTAAGLGLDALQQAAPIISGFLLGYVAILPIIGRVSDLRGRVPVLLGSLVVFALGSVMTAAAYNLEWMVAGRLVQGIGGGGLIPPTLALIADRWPPQRRGMPLGVIGAVQELGSVAGPLYGAVVLAFGDWRSIFWLNAAVGLVLAAAFLPQRDVGDETDSDSDSGSASESSAGRRFTDWPGLALAVAAIVAGVVVMVEPASLVTGVTSGLAFLPVTGESRWLSPLALVVVGLVMAFLVRQATAATPALAWRSWGELGRQIDAIGAAALTTALGAIILTFATAEPETSAISPQAAWLLPVAAVAVAVFVWRQRVARHPLIPRGTLSSRSAVGAVVVSFFVGAALIAALVDIPFFARLTTETNDQLGAALVLVRFLVALPVGALVGGALLRWIGPAWITAAAMALSGWCFLTMGAWPADALEHPVGASIVLLACGFGFGLAIAPVNAALLDHTADDVHGVASSLVIVARMVGMLIGISVLTTLGLSAFHDAVGDIPSVQDLCDGAATACTAYNREIRDAAISQLHVVFLGAGVSSFVAAVLAMVSLPMRRTERASNLLA